MKNGYPASARSPVVVVASPQAPLRLAQVVGAHLLTNLVHGLHDVPLLLGVHGPPGEGKTRGVQITCEAMGVEIVAPPAEAFEDHRAGQPLKAMLRTYEEVGRRIAARRPAAIVIEDVDQRLGRADAGVQVTSNLQHVGAALMELADKPTVVSGRHAMRVPIVVTANRLEALYAPLRRDGRMTRFEWRPTLEDRLPVLQSMFPEAALTRESLKTLLGANGVRTAHEPRARADRPVPTVAMFAEVRSRLRQRQAEQLIEVYGWGEALHAALSGRIHATDLDPQITFDVLRDGLGDVLDGQRLRDHLEA